jgi:hypothetical protein
MRDDYCKTLLLLLGTLLHLMACKVNGRKRFFGFVGKTEFAPLK